VGAAVLGAEVLGTSSVSIEVGAGQNQGEQEEVETDLSLGLLVRSHKGFEPYCWQRKGNLSDLGRCCKMLSTGSVEMS
jgi:hypothetical protein